MTKIIVNNKPVNVTAEPDTPLLWLIREQIGLTGTKFGCGIAQCGACSIHINGNLMRSCVYTFSMLKEGDQITTIEGLSPTASHPVQQAWAKIDVPQCGYCQSGQIMAASALLKRKPNPTDADIDNEMTNICRCGTYPRIREAIHIAVNIAKTTPKV
jgi:isoquinoline 1-oxidoreductase alpha subunit